MAMIDYLLIVALDEENTYLLKVLSDVKAGSAASPRLVEKRLYSREMVNDGLNDLTVAVLPVGRMGESAMQAATTDAIRTWRPRDVILIGIAGSLDAENLLLGDVIVPAKVFGCTEAKAKVVDGEERRDFRKTGDRAASALIDIMRAVNIDDSMRESWRASCRASIDEGSPLYKHLRGQDSEDARPSIHISFNDSLASGTDVIASKKAATELKEQVDPTIRAVEMESRGVFEAVERFDEKIRILIVRGISDYADEDKAAIEKDFKDGWRRFSMENAVRLVLTMIMNRRKIDETYLPLPGPKVDLVHAPNSWEKCAAAGIYAKGAGATAIAFQRLISWPAGTPELQMTIEATGLDGQPIEFEQAVVAPAGGMQIKALHTGRMKLEYKVPRSDDPPPLEGFFALKSAPARIKLKFLDEFNRKYSEVWLSQKEGGDVLPS